MWMRLLNRLFLAKIQTCTVNNWYASRKIGDQGIIPTVSYSSIFNNELPLLGSKIFNSPTGDRAHVAPSVHLSVSGNNFIILAGEMWPGLFN